MNKCLGSLVFVLALGFSSAFAQDSLVAARELYASAAYEDALDVLKKMQAPAGAEVASTDGEVLKAFCLLALRRQDEARSVIETVVVERPTYLPGDDDASPRIRAAFQDVRRKLLPSVARQLYASARADYDAKNMSAAGAKFNELLQVLSDPDLAHDDTMADLRVLAEGFRVVSAAAANVASSADTNMQTRRADSSTTAPTSGSASGNPAPSANGGSAAVPPLSVPVTPPVIISQQMPPWHPDRLTTRTDFTGAIDLLIDEQGHVESVSLRKSIHPLYDPLLLQAARNWTYQPAKRGDEPIKFHKTVIVKLNNGAQ